MFGVGGPEIIGIVLIIFLVYGPDQMPAMIKKVVGFWRQMKSLTDEVTSTVSREVHRIEKDIHLDSPKNILEKTLNPPPPKAKDDKPE